MDKFPEVGAERQDLRQYPAARWQPTSSAGIDWDGHGLLGPGGFARRRPGRYRRVGHLRPRLRRRGDPRQLPQPAQRGERVHGAVDARRRHPVLRPAAGAAGQGCLGAKNVSAVVLDAKTGEVLAMSNDNTFDPSQDIGRQEDRELGNPAVSSPFEPGSVNKIVTAASVIEFGLSNPDEVLQVPGSIDMGGVTVGDAWDHGVMPYTTTGVFGKSSNVGTLMLAQRVGPERLRRNAAPVRSRSAHRRRTARRERGPGAADRPVVGQHLLQPAHRAGSFDDAAADDRDVPDHRQRRCRACRRASSRPPSRRTAPAPTSPGPKAFGWCRRRPRRPCATCCAPWCSATRWATSRAPARRPAVEGYQIAGKTGTAQQINPACGCYYNDVYWITFAGIATADDPRYVVGS